MAKIATAHIEIKPVLNEEALQDVLRCIEEAVAAGFERGVEAALSGRVHRIGNPGDRSREEVIDFLAARGHHIEK